MTWRRLSTLVVYGIAIFGLWMIGGVIVTAFEWWRLDLFSRFRIDWAELVNFGMQRGCNWAYITPVIIYAALALPVRRPRAVRNALLLSGAAVAAVVLRETYGTLLKQAAEEEAWNAGEIAGALALRFDVDLIIVLGMMIATQAVRLQWESSEQARRAAKLEVEVAHAQLRQLRADLQPHFLFNALHNIAALVHTDPLAADRMLMSLSTLLRRTLEFRQASHITLSDELSITQDYLELSQMRFGDQLTFAIGAEDEVLDALVPPLLLQPLVENAVKHGALAKGQAARIEVRAFADGGRLRLQVCDNGESYDPARVLEESTIGLPNTQARLALLYGSDASLDLRKASRELVVEVGLPLRLGSGSDRP